MDFFFQGKTYEVFFEIFWKMFAGILNESKEVYLKIFTHPFKIPEKFI